MDSERELAVRAGRELADASADDVVRWAADRYADRLVLTSNMSNAVLVHLASRLVPGIDVIFLDTGYHFPETLGTRDAVRAAMDVRVVDVRPALSVAEQDAEHGARLYERAPDECCRMRKVEPLRLALTGYQAWMTGLRREESPARARIPVVGWDSRFGLVKVNPLARWTTEQLHAYADEHHVLVNPLLSEGYSSIGCAPCTRKVAPGEDLRGGRWPGRRKSECGLHA